MTSLTLSGGSLVLKGDALGVDSGCCCQGSCGEETRTYSYGDSVPESYTSFDNCPNYSDCDGAFVIGWFWFGLVPSRIGQAGPGDCAGDTFDCYVRSIDFPDGCQSPKATIYAGSTLDDYGTISGPSDTITLTDPCPGTGLGIVETTTTITPYVVSNGDGTKYLKLNVSVTNHPNRGGPYGVASLSVRWWFG